MTLHHRRAGRNLQAEAKQLVTATWKDEFVTANGVRLHYLDWGGDGPVALFLHPTGFHAHVWDPYVRRLAGRYRCLALDARGHGDSGKPGSYLWPELAADLRGFMTALGLRDAVGVGHSGGATMIAVNAAAQPGLFSHAVLLDPILFFEGQPQPASSDNTLSVGARKRRMDWPSRAAILARFGSRPPFSLWAREFLDLYVAYGVRDNADGSVTLKCDGEDEAAVYLWEPHRVPCDEILPRVTCPVLLVGGAESEAFTPEKAAHAARLLPRAEVVSVPGVGHFVPFERPALVQDAIDRFLAAQP